MIVSCPSCDSKYQVADEKVAGNVLRTRCKACGSQILVDGTIPPGPNNEEDDDVTRIMRPEDRPDLGESQAPASGNRWTVHVSDSDTRPMTANEIVQAVVNGSLADGVSVWKSGMANWASIAEVPELMTAIEQTGRRPRPNTSAGPGNTKPPPPARAATANSSPRTGTGPSNGPTRTSKLLAPARAAAPPPSFRSPAVKPSPVVAISKQIENQKDALDPAASTGDFYSKMMNKVGSKSKSAPPAAAAETKPTNRPRATMPPPREASPAMASRNSPGRTSTIRKEPPVANVPSNLDPDAAPSDFYGKLLAKVRPQTADSAPPAGADSRLPGAGRTTLTPPTWGAIANPPENYAQATRVPASTQPVAGSPIRVLGSSGSAAAELAAGAVDIPINIDTDDVENEPQVAPAPVAAARRASPTPPRRPDPIIPVDIQLPPMDGAGGPTVVVAKSTPPPAAEPRSEAKPEVKSETLLKPTTEIVTDNTSPGLRSRPGKRKGFGGIIAILTVGLICAGGGVAATVYMLKKSETKNTGPAAPSASQAAAQANNVPAQASGGQPQAKPPPTGTDESFDADEASKTGPGAANAMRGVAGKRSAKAGAGDTPATYAANTPTAPSAASKTPAAAGAVDPTMPGWLEASVQSKSNKADKAAAAKPAAPDKPAAPAKPSGPTFNRDAAMAVLGIAASQAPSCKRPGGPTGNGKALVTFDTDGQVVIANIVGEGIAGTPVARCVASIFQRIKVAPFSGDRATVSKPFTIPP